jgi:4-oxalocrotonate tautomerase
MPHVILKLAVGRSEETKAQIAEAITQVVMAHAHCDESAVSVAIEDVAPADWAEKVFRPEIAGNWEKLYKKPGYDPL